MKIQKNKPNRHNTDCPLYWGMILLSVITGLGCAGLRVYRSVQKRSQAPVRVQAAQAPVLPQGNRQLTR